MHPDPTLLRCCSQKLSLELHAALKRRTDHIPLGLRNKMAEMTMFLTKMTSSFIDDI